MKEAIAEQLRLTKKGHKAKGIIEHKDGNTIYKVEDHGKVTPNK